MPNQTISKLYEKFQMTTSRLKKVKDGKGIGEQEFKFDCNYDEKTDCPIPYITCVCKGSPIPTSIDGPEAGVRMRCSNESCQMTKILMHKKCFEKLEENLLKILTKKGSARGWTDVQRRSNLWEKKGQGLVGNMLLCHCGHGMMCLDVDFYKEKELEEQRRNQLLAESKQRKKCNKKSKLPMVNYSNNGPVPPELLQDEFVPPGKLPTQKIVTSTSNEKSKGRLTRGIGLTTKTIAIQIAQKGGQQSRKTSTMEKRPLALVQTHSIPVPTPKSESGTFYSLFDPGARSFNLGELLLGESRLPGLITQQRLFSHV